jgi:hypothetical protein
MGSFLCAKYLARGALWMALWFLESRREAFLSAWRLAHTPERAGWGWSKVHEDLPPDVFCELGQSVTLLEFQSLSWALLHLMGMMGRRGPELARLCRHRYPQTAAKAVTRLVAQALATAPERA